GASGHSVEEFQEEDGVDLRALEFDVVLRLVSALARTEPGQATVLRITPSHEPDLARRRLAELQELQEFHSREGKLPVAGLQDVTGPLDALERSGGAASFDDLRAIFSSARAA